MEITIWWDSEADPKNPWHFYVNCTGQSFSGCRTSLHLCWKAIDEGCLMITTPAVQDNQPRVLS